MINLFYNFYEYSEKQKLKAWLQKDYSDYYKGKIFLINRK